MITDMQKFKQEAQSLYWNIYERDAVTGGHCLRVSEYTENYLRYMGRPESEVLEGKYAALIHDAGKIDIPDKVLKSKTKFTQEDRDIMDTHSEGGLTHLTPALKESQMTIDGMTHHHTSFNPDKAKGGHSSHLRGKDIPEFPRILAVFDVYDALSRARMYKDEISQIDVFNSLKWDAKLDQDIVKTAIPFIKQYEKTKETIELSQIENTTPQTQNTMTHKIGAEFNKKLNNFLTDNEKHKYAEASPETFATNQWNTITTNLIRSMPVVKDSKANKYDPMPVYDTSSGKITKIEYMGEGTGNKIGEYKITKNDAHKIIKGLSLILEDSPQYDTTALQYFYKIANMMSDPTDKKIQSNAKPNINPQTVINNSKQIKSINNTQYQYE